MNVVTLQVTVVEETIRYIDELHNALAVKLQSKTGSYIIIIIIIIATSVVAAAAATTTS